MVRVLVLSSLGAAAAGALVDRREAWEAFKIQHERHYDAREDADRFEIFRHNVDHVEAENAKQQGYTLDVVGSPFADLTTDEFRSRVLSGFSARPVGARLNGPPRTSGPGAATLPDSVDWVARGAVNPPLDEGFCGATWAISTVATIESAWFLETGSLVSVSTQQFLDCDERNNGCNGGFMDLAFEFSEGVDLCSVESYSYDQPTGQFHECRSAGCDVAIPKGGVTGFMDVNGTEEALMAAVAKQPVTVAIEADQFAFQTYQSGILSDVCGSNVNHAATVVGYGSENGQDYWLLRNQWGTSWGEEGFFRLKRGMGGKGECGITAEPSYPVVQATLLV